MPKICCVVCKTSFYVKPYQEHIREYCSRKCFGIGNGRKMQKVCPPHLEKYKVQKGSLGINKGRKWSEETRAKMSASHTGKRVGDNNPAWRGARVLDKQSGYIRIRINGRYFKEHRYVMEQHLGRPLTQQEYIHHKNGVKDDNRIENLEIVTVNSHKSHIQCPFCLKYFYVK